MILDSEGPGVVPIQGVPKEDTDKHHPEPGEQGEIVKRVEIVWCESQPQQPREINSHLGHNEDASEDAEEPYQKSGYTTPNERVHEQYRQADAMQDAKDDEPVMGVHPGDQGDQKTKSKNTPTSL